MSHSSVGSSTKLLLTYSYLLNELAKEIGCTLEKGLKIDSARWKSCRYHFLLSCDVEDRTRAWNLSWKIHVPYPGIKKYRYENDIIVMSIPERSLLDVRGTLMRTMHELWHFCGHRMRTKRCKYIIEDAAFRLAEVIVNVLFDKELLLRYILDSNLDYKFMDSVSRKAVKDDADKIVQNNINGFIEDVQKEIVELVNAKTSANFENVCDYYYGEKIFPHLKNVTEELFVDKGDTSETVWGKIYDYYMERSISIYQEALERYDNPPLREFYWKLKYRTSKDTKMPDEKVIGRIQYILNYMAGNNLSVTIEGNCNQQYEEALLDDNSVNEVYDLLASVYSETFSDDMACCCLGCTVEEYIFSFIYENPNVEKSFALVPRRVLRIGAILERRFFKDGTFFLDVGTLEKMWIEMFGLASPDDKARNPKTMAEKIKTCIETIWEYYKTEGDKRYIKNLGKYLDEAEKNHEVIFASESCKIIKSIRGIYSKARNMDTHEKVMDVIQALMQEWSNMAKVKEMAKVDKRCEDR